MRLAVEPSATPRLTVILTERLLFRHLGKTDKLVKIPFTVYIHELVWLPSINIQLRKVKVRQKFR